MKEFIKVLLNNLDESAYWEAKANYDFYDKEGIIARKLSKEGNEWDDYEQKAIQLRRENRKQLYKLMKAYFKKGISILAPYLLALDLGVVCFGRKDYTKEMPIYQKHTVEFDQDFLYEDTVDTKEYITYPSLYELYTCLDELEYFNHSTAYLYIGYGKDGKYIEYSIDKMNDWQAVGPYSSDYFYWENEKGEEILDSQKFDQILEEAIETYLTDFSHKKIFEDSYLRMKIEYYEEIRKEIVEFEGNKAYDVFTIFLILLFLSTTIFLQGKENTKGKNKLKEAIANDDVFKKKKGDIPFLKAYKYYITTFIKAEQARIKNMAELLQQYALDEEVFLSSYEKELIKKEIKK